MEALLMADLGDISTNVQVARAASSMAVPAAVWPDVSSSLPPIGFGRESTDLADTHFGSVS